MSDASGGRRWTRFVPQLLLVSVALNLLLAGVFLGRWTMPTHPPPGLGGMMRHMIDDVGRAMNDADRAILEQAYRDHAHDLENHWSDHRAAFDAVRQAMAAEPFDRTALERAMDAAAKQDITGRAAVEQTLLDAASKMSADGRHRMAGWQPGPPPR